MKRLRSAIICVWFATITSAHLLLLALQLPAIHVGPGRLVVFDNESALIVVNTENGGLIDRISVPRGRGNFVDESPVPLLLWQPQKAGPRAYSVSPATAKVIDTVLPGDSCPSWRTRIEGATATFVCSDKPVTLDLITGKIADVPRPANPAEPSWPLPPGFRIAERSADGQFLYLTNFDAKRRKGELPRLQIRSTADGTVLEDVVLNDLARWERPIAGVGQRFLHNFDGKGARTSLLVLDGRSVVSFAMPGASRLSLQHDRDHSRLFVAAYSTLSEFTLPAFAHIADLPLKERIQWNTRGALNLAVSPDGRRGLWMHGDNVTIYDLETHTLMGSLTLGTGRAKTKQVLGDIGGSMAMAAIGSSSAGSAAPVAATFSNDGATAYALASTGELATIDIPALRITSHRNGGDLMIRVARLALLVRPDNVRVFDCDTAEEVQVVKLPDGFWSNSNPAVAVSRDGSRLLVYRGPTAYVLDSRTGKTVTTLLGFSRVSGARFLD